MGLDLNVKFVGVSCGWGSVLAWTEDGGLYAFGEQKHLRKGKHGPLGLGHTDNIANPERVPIDGRVVGISSGQHHVVVEVAE